MGTIIHLTLTSRSLYFPHFNEHTHLPKENQIEVDLCGLVGPLFSKSCDAK